MTQHGAPEVLARSPAAETAQAKDDKGYSGHWCCRTRACKAAVPTAVFTLADPEESTLQQLPNIRQVQLLAIAPGALHASLLTRGNVKRSEGANATARTSTCCGRRLEKEVVSSWETCWCTKAALLGKAAGPSASTSHRGAAMASSLTMRNRWCRMRVCVLKPGLWNVSAFSDE